MSIYKELLDAVSNGKRFKIDLVTKSLIIDKKKIIEKGVMMNNENENELISRWDLALEKANSLPLDEDCWRVVDELYQDFKYSVPKEHSTTNGSYFKAIDSSELNLYQMSMNDDRDYAQAKLEGYILLASLQGWLIWQNDSHWFWQSKFDKDLVVLRHLVKE